MLRPSIILLFCFIFFSSFAWTEKAARSSHLVTKAIDSRLGLIFSAFGMMKRKFQCLSFIPDYILEKDCFGKRVLLDKRLSSDGVYTFAARASCLFWVMVYTRYKLMATQSRERLGKGKGGKCHTLYMYTWTCTRGIFRRKVF
jgi:hypothetical protein